MNIEQLKIVIKTAIPGKDRIELKSDILYVPDTKGVSSELNAYPYIVANQVFNKTALQNDLYAYGYSIIVNFFFNKKTFIQYLSTYAFPDNTTPVPANGDPNEIKRLKEANKEKQKDNLLKNVSTMLELLFPMSYPASLNISDSFSLYIRQNIDFDLNSAFSKVSKNFLKKIGAVTESVQSKDFSYLKLDGTIYTITKVTWLNDVLNHPIYRDFVNEYINFTQYSVQQRDLLKDIVEDKIKVLFGKIKEPDSKEPTSLNIYKDFLGKFIENLEKYMELNSKKASTTQKVSSFIFNVTNIIIALLHLYNLHQEPKVSIDEYTTYFKELFEFYKNENVKKSKWEVEAEEKAKAEAIAKGLPTPESKRPTNPNLLTFANMKNTPDPEYISELSVHITDLNKFYSSTDKGDAESLSGISSVFSTRLNKIVNEIKVINTSIAIKDKYIRPNPIINLTGEDQAIIDELKANFSIFMSFVDKIKELMPPIRSSMNTELQQRIINYSKGKNKPGVNVNPGNISFSDIIEAIKNQYIYVSPSSEPPPSNINLLSNPSDQELIKTEICELDKRNQELPHYEIFVALNLIEGEMKSDNLDDIKCIYRGMYVGKESMDFFTRYNKYDINQHLFFLSQKEINEEKSSNPIKSKTEALPKVAPKQSESATQMPPLLPPPPPTQVQGGTRKKSMYRKMKTRRYRCCKTKSNKKKVSSYSRSQMK
jgi:hypothetical protein